MLLFLIKLSLNSEADDYGDEVAGSFHYRILNKVLSGTLVRMKGSSVVFFWLFATERSFLQWLLWWAVRKTLAERFFHLQFG